MYHNPVLLHECLEGLAIQRDGYYVDVTYGGGGHAKEILKLLDNGKLIAFDQDNDSLANKVEDPNLIFIQENFRELKKNLQLFQMLPVDGILADLGISSHQIDTAERGFSTRFEGEIDMRMDRSLGLKASDVVNTYTEEQLYWVFKSYGELKNSKQIARLIVRAREAQEIKVSGELKAALKPCTPRGKEQKFLAQLYQAIRIEVNDELGALKEMLKQSAEVLKPGGRLVVMSYHSLEDRLVKNFIKTGNFEGVLEKDFFGNPITNFKQITRKPITPKEIELIENTRSRECETKDSRKAMIKRNELKSRPVAGTQASSGKSSAVKRGLQNILGGGFLTKDGIVNLLPFLFFATFLTILYIANIYYAEKDIREINALKVEMKELRYEYITSKSRLMNIGKQSEVSKRLQGSGVKESIVPPYKLFVIKTEDN